MRATDDTPKTEEKIDQLKMNHFATRFCWGEGFSCSFVNHCNEAFQGEKIDYSEFIVPTRRLPNFEIVSVQLLLKLLSAILYP